MNVSRAKTYYGRVCLNGCCLEFYFTDSPRI